jgi:organic radical activating enzyme
MNLVVNEIFYSLQGEGGRSGSPSVFIRLTQCNLACSFCDTDFFVGKEMTVDEILEQIKDYPTHWIIWTGGEPTIQLSDEVVRFFNEKGYKQAIETNGTRRVPALIDYITCSPKLNYASIRNRIPKVNEIRIPVQIGDQLPDTSILPEADSYFVSPIFDQKEMNRENVDYCVELVKKHPQWSLSLQIHKLIDIE